MIDTTQLQNDEESIIHVAAVRLRVVGSGNLNIRLMNLGYSKTYDLKPLVIPKVDDGIEPTRLANFKSQRVFTKISTSQMNEFFNINRVVHFVKVVSAAYPG